MKNTNRITKKYEESCIHSMPSLLNQSKGVFLLIYSLLFIMMIFSLILLQTKISFKDNVIQEELIKSINIRFEQKLFLNNLKFLITKTIEQFVDKGIFDKSQIIHNINTNVFDYFINNGFSVPLDFNTNAKLILDIAGYAENKATYMYIIDSNIYKEYTVNNRKLIFVLPSNYVFGDSLEK